MRYTGTMQSWHNVSANASNINLNHVTANDLLSVIKTIVEKYGTDQWITFVTDLYKHIVNFQNPHQLTIEQLDQQIIDVVYNQWIKEGYKGSKNEFLDIFFQEVEFANVNDVERLINYTVNGLDETVTIDDKEWALSKVPVVAILKEYITEWHNAYMYAHKRTFERYFGTKENSKYLPHPPVIKASKLHEYGIANMDKYNYLNQKTTVITDYPFNGVLGVQWIALFYLHIGSKTNGASSPFYASLLSTSAQSHHGFILRCDKDNIYLQLKMNSSATDAVTELHTIPHGHTADKPYLNCVLQSKHNGDYNFFYDDKKVSITAPYHVYMGTERKDYLFSFSDIKTDVHQTTYGMPLSVYVFNGMYTDKEIQSLITTRYPTDNGEMAYVRRQ